MEIRTDLAMEQLAPDQEALPKGVSLRQENRFGQKATVVEIRSRQGAMALGKPQGMYITIEVENVLRREKESFQGAVQCISGYIRELMQFGNRLPVLVAGLGNREITPDAVGPLTADHVLVTRHMVQKLPKQFGVFRPVSAFVPGVLGTTGLESAETIRALVERTEAAGVIAVDAIAARDTGRLCSTVQISNTGIWPGSGIGNSRLGVDEASIGVPVIAVGVPTVTDARTLAMDVLGETAESHIPCNGKTKGMIVTCSDIDKRVREIARVLSFGINAALQPELGLDELTDLTF